MDRHDMVSQNRFVTSIGTEAGCVRGEAEEDGLQDGG